MCKKKGAKDFVSFYAQQEVVIKDNQIPFLPDTDNNYIDTLTSFR